MTQYPTIEQHLNTLPEGFKELAFEAVNTQRKVKERQYILTKPREFLSQAICSAFVWMVTPEGHEFWGALQADAEHNEYLNYITSEQ